MQNPDFSFSIQVESHQRVTPSPMVASPATQCKVCFSIGISNISNRSYLKDSHSMVWPIKIEVAWRGGLCPVREGFFHAET